LERLLEGAEEADDSVGCRCILITQAVGKSISPDGTENTKPYVHGPPDITNGPWQVEDATDTLDSGEEVVYMVVDGAGPCPST